MAALAPTGTPVTGGFAQRFAGERHWRLFAAATLIAMQTLAAVGLGWDIQWHRWLGRDAFLTPPHLIIYTGVVGAGLTCIVVVLVETWRYWRRVPGVDQTSTVSLLGIFHAPLGFIVAGFGALTMAVAAPLDNYWHQLYGVDVTLWAPFHMMGLIGAGIAYLGAAYALASELVRSRRDGTAGRRVMIFGWPGIALGALFALTAVLRLVRVLMEPSIETFPTWQLGPIEVLTSPIGLTVAVVLTSMAAVVMLRKPGAATLMTFMAALFTATVTLLGPIAVRIVGDASGYTYRLPGHPHINWIQVLLPFAYVLPAIAVDVAYLAELRRWHRMRASLLAGLAGSLPMTAIATILTLDGISSTDAALRMLPASSNELPPQPAFRAIALGAIVALAAGAYAGRAGEQLGRIWRLNTR
ncbi:MAG TPA: hypothetical protein VN961_05835 [Streptosporangiaceae bacterium]|nr:hypothetical protein [Streptosporangiaceae bacterium]